MIATALSAQGKTGGRLLALDRDPRAVERARHKLQAHIDQGYVQLHCGTLADSYLLADDDYLASVDGILLDIGLSFDQLDDPERGFSFTIDGPLDMRMDQSQRTTAATLLNELDAEALAKIFFEFGDERRSRKLAATIIEARDEQPLQRTQQLVDIILRALRPRGHDEKMRYLSRNFQALRMAVNDELGLLERELARAVELLKPGGRLVVISFHSGEDRVVKHFLREQARDCVCPPQVLRCVCSHRAKLEILTKKPLRPTQAECDANPRARSALMRVAVRLAGEKQVAA
jgi:16S rRNA (cytosine1402-N4)-methyltransferase